MKKWLALLLVVTASGCPDVKTDPGQGQGSLPPLDGPTVEFDPARSIVPSPNNLALDPATHKVTIGPAACETATAKALREGVLNKLDGFGAFEAAMQVTFTEPVDETTLTNNIVMYQRAKGTTANDPGAATAVPLKLVKSQTPRFDASSCTTPKLVDAVTVIPTVPLDEHATYTLAVLQGVKTATGQDYLPSFTWALVRQKADPVTLADGCNYKTYEGCVVTSESTPLDPAGDANGNGVPDLQELVGLDLLWKAHAQAMAFLDAKQVARDKVLVAWEVTVQTTTDPLDPSVAGSPAAGLGTSALQGANTVVPGGGGNSRAFIEGVYQQLGLAPDAATATAICNQLGCDFVGDVLGAGLGAPNFQTHVMNPFSGTANLPGPWSDPVMPAQQDPFTYHAGATQLQPGVIPVLAFVPKCPNPACVSGQPPAGGWPVVVFGHGLGSRKESLFVFAPQLARAGFASVAIDFVSHGDRAIRISSDPAIGCADTGNNPPEPSSHLQCYASFLTTDLAATRDNIRQTVLDLQRLVKATKSCGTTACSTLQVDPGHVVYAGISLGGIIGSVLTASMPDVKAAVVSVPGAGWVDILENSQTLAIRCPLVDGLIDAGILMGEKWNHDQNPATATGLCVTDAWQAQPGYRQFSAVARWVLDPADPANFAAKLAQRTFLIQEVVGDKVVPNVGTDDEGALTGMMPMAADPYIGGTTASAAITTMPTSSKWVRYMNLPADSGTGFPGNTFAHASLLQPADATTAGQLGTGRMQVDAITFLSINK